MAYTRLILTPESAQFKTTVFPALYQSSDASGARRYLAYDASADEAAYWTTVWPQGMGAGYSLVIYYAMASATSGNTIWDVAIEAIASGGTVDTDSAESLDAVNTSSATASPGTAGYMTTASITLTNIDTAAEGNLVRIRIRRVGSSGSDTAAGDANMFVAELRDSV